MNMITRFWRWVRKPNKTFLEQIIEAIVVLGPIALALRTFGYGLYRVPTGSMETTMLCGEGFIADKFTIWFKPAQRGDIITFNDPLFHYGESFLTRGWQNYIGQPPKAVVGFVDWFQRYFDIVWGPSNWTKRVIGVPGDHVQGVIEDGRPVVYVNGEKLDEPYLNQYPLITTFKLGPLGLNDIRLGCSDCSCSKSYDPQVDYAQQPFYRIDPLAVLYRDGKPFLRGPHTPREDGRDVFDIHLGSDEYWAMGDNRLGSFDSRDWGPLKAHLIHGKIKFRLWSIDSDEPWLIMDFIKHPLDIWSRMRWGRWISWVR